jgi:hypothetical protein
MESVIGALHTAAARAGQARRRGVLLALARELQRPVQRLRPRRDALALRRRLRHLQESLGEQGSREGTQHLYLSKET